MAVARKSVVEWLLQGNQSLNGCRKEISRYYMAERANRPSPSSSLRSQLSIATMLLAFNHNNATAACSLPIFTRHYRDSWVGILCGDRALPYCQLIVPESRCTTVARAHLCCPTGQSATAMDGLQHWPAGLYAIDLPATNRSHAPCRRHCNPMSDIRAANVLCFAAPIALTESHPHTPPPSILP